MANVGIKGTAYCLNFAAELALHYGGTPAQERHLNPDSEYLKALPDHAQSYDDAAGYAPNKTYIGAMSVDELTAASAPWLEHIGTSVRYGSFGEIMPEDEFLGFLDFCDVFDLIWLEKSFAARIREKLAQDPVVRERQLARLEAGHDAADIADAVAKHGALPLYAAGEVVGCCRPAHDTDENLSATSCWRIWPARPVAYSPSCI